MQKYRKYMYMVSIVLCKTKKSFFLPTVLFVLHYCMFMKLKYKLGETQVEPTVIRHPIISNLIH